MNQVVASSSPLGKTRHRLDALLVARGCVKSREQAHRLILAGAVIVNGHVVDKPGKVVGSDVAVNVLTSPRFVSRAGEKLAAALDAWAVSCAGAVAMDVGASTGGFTDCLLQYGAARVYAVDVGYGQLDWKLRTDPRVVVLERTNIRYLPREALAEPVGLAVVDVSFISLRLVLPCVVRFLAREAIVITLVKPQFEVGRARVGRGGIVRDERARLDALECVKQAGEDLGLQSIGVVESPVPGRKGNREMVLGFRWNEGTSAV